MKRFSISLSFTILLSMALRKELTDFEKGIIYGCHLCDKSQSEIAQLTGHPKSTIDSFLRKYRSTDSHVNKERSDRLNCLGNRDQRHLVRLVKQATHRQVCLQFAKICIPWVSTEEYVQENHLFQKPFAFGVLVGAMPDLPGLLLIDRK